MRELVAAQKALATDDLLAQRRAAWQAHLTAGWQRAKKMPKWERVAKRFDRATPKPPQSPQELLAKAMQINKLLGGKDLRTKGKG